MVIDRAKFLDEDEVKVLCKSAKQRAAHDRILNKPRGLLMWLVVDMALSTGLRVSELVRIQAEDIDLKRGSIKIIRSKKKKAREETLAISKELVKHLRAHLKWSKQKKGPLFVGERGPLTEQGLQKIWRRAIMEAELPELSIHSARHSCATQLMRKTKNLVLVQRQLGHESPTTTANMYCGVTFEDLQDALNGLYS